MLHVKWITPYNRIRLDQLLYKVMRIRVFFHLCLIIRLVFDTIAVFNISQESEKSIFRDRNKKITKPSNAAIIFELCFKKFLKRVYFQIIKNNGRLIC